MGSLSLCSQFAKNLSSGQGAVRVYVKNAEELREVEQSINKGKSIQYNFSSGKSEPIKQDDVSKKTAFDKVHAYRYHKDSFTFFKESVRKLVGYGDHQKRYACVTLTLDNGKVTKGHLSSIKGVGLYTKGELEGITGGLELLAEIKALNPKDQKAA